MRLLERNGFTLLETVLAMMIVGIIAVAMGQILNIGMDSYVLVADRRAILQDGKLAMNMMEGDLQTIPDPSANITTITSTQISFTNAGGQPVVYRISGGVLTRNSKTLAMGVGAGSGFTFYTLNDVVTANPALVYRIRIVLAIDSGGTSGSVTLRNNVYLRNRYYESFLQS